MEKRRHQGGSKILKTKLKSYKNIKGYKMYIPKKYRYPGFWKTSFFIVLALTYDKLKRK